MASSMKHYDVFLSFRGEDTRHGVTSRIYKALEGKKVKTYMDDKNLERGEDIALALLAAIERSRISVVVFSRGYSSSSWCLNELVHIHKCRIELGQIVLPVFFGVDSSHVRKQGKGSYTESIERHKNNPLHTADTIKEWRSALKASADLSGLHYPQLNSSTNSRAETALVEDVVNTVLKTLNRDAMPAELDDFEGPMGMENHFRNIKSLLMSGSMGKTTTADAVWSRIRHEFDRNRFLKDVRELSRKRGLENLRRELISSMLPKENLTTPVPNHSRERLHQTKLSHWKRMRGIVSTRAKRVLLETDITREAFDKYEVKV